MTTRRDWLLASAFSGAIMLTTMAPYLLHWARPVQGRVYTGIERFENDQCSYLMWINQVRNGHSAVTNLYVHDVTDRFAPHPLWWLLGIIGRVVPLSSIALYHAARVLLGLAYLLVLFALVGRFCHDSLTRWVAWWLCAVGGGLGWVYALATGESSLRGMVVSADYMPEMWSYSSLLYFPHFATGLMMMSGSVVWLWRGWEEGKWGWSAGSGLLLGLLALVHTYTAVTLLTVLAAHGLWWTVTTRRGRPVLRESLIAGVASMPGFLLQFQQARTHEALRRWAESNVMESAAPWTYALGLGLVGVAAVAGAILLIRRGRQHPCGPDQAHTWGCAATEEDAGRRAELSFVLLWIAGTFALLYSTLPFERRCVEGLHIPLCLLAAPVLVSLARWLAYGRQPLVLAYAIVLVGLCAPTSVWYLAREMPSREGYVEPGVFEAEEAAFRQFGPEARVLCKVGPGQWIASQGRVRVYAGHMQLTYEVSEKSRLVRRFLDAATPAPERMRMFTRTGCQCVAAAGKDTRVLRRDDLWREVWGEGRWGVFVPKG